MLDALTQENSETRLAHYLAESRASSKHFLDPELAQIVFNQLLEIIKYYDFAALNFVDAGEKAILSLTDAQIVGISFNGIASLDRMGLLEPDLS